MPNSHLAIAAALAALVLAAPGAGSSATLTPAEAARLLDIPEAGLSTAGPAGNPPAIEVRRDGTVIAHVASTAELVRSVGYSGRPIDIRVAVDPDGRIAGAELVSQSEPILTIGITEDDLARFVSGFAGLDLRDVVRVRSDGALPDAIGGATHSSAVIADAILRTARLLALSRGMFGAGAGAQVDRTSFAPTDWAGLRAQAAIASRRLSVGEVRTALGADVYRASGASDDALFADLTLALLTPPSIGQNLLGARAYAELGARMDASDNAILVASNGLYSVKGTAWRRSGVFERIEIVQAERTIRLTQAGHLNVAALAAAGAPEVREAAAFVIPASTGFDPARPFRLSLLVDNLPGAPAGTGTVFDLAYALPALYLAGGAAGTEALATDMPPAWVEAWRTSLPQIAALGVLLAVLSAILVFQDWVARRRRLYRTVRLGFLAATLFGLGWGLGAQLSVVHVLAFAQSLVTGFQWDTFLLDPLIFILWGFVAVALLFWGRGVFCGWLCPFGALQELLNEGARALKIPQIEVPFALQERLWPIKYILFLGLFAVSLGSIRQAFVLAEIEPFKTAITLWFAREWPFVAYALALLAAGLFIERFYCRFLCPLGAALAIPGRLRMFEWLKRRHQCGRECRLCATRCTVGAIHPDGHINPNECIYCLNCQTLYFDRHTCPALMARERRRGPAGAAPAAAGSGEAP